MLAFLIRKVIPAAHHSAYFVYIYLFLDREVPVYDSESYRADRLTSSDNENIEDSSKETSLAYLFEVIRKTFRNDACVSSAMHLIERFQKEGKNFVVRILCGRLLGMPTS